VNDLRSFAALQARVYEFLERQDEATLRAIVSGAAQLAVHRTVDAPAPNSFAPRDDARSTHRPASAGLAIKRSPAPSEVAQHLSTLASEHERRIYLNATKLLVKDLREVARVRDLGGHHKLRRAELIDLLVASEQHATAQQVPPSIETTTPNADAVAIASHLRETETETDGAAYLHAQHLDRESLLAVAAELGLTRVSRLSQTELEKRVLKQAIGARRKFAGLRKW
jgi:hypothetical protein